MAIGDAVGEFLGTGTVNRQPASGVEEQITAVIKAATTDGFAIYNGSSAFTIFAATVVTHVANTGAAPFNGYNLAIMITNSIYLRKLGTTDIIAVLGVQTNV